MGVRVTFLVLLISSCTALCEAPVQIQVLNFAGNRLWHATETVLVEEGGRYKAIKNQSVQIGGCQDFLALFQERPLEVMFKNRYISQPVYEFLKTKLKDKVDSRQLLLVTLFSDVPEDEALETFKKALPADLSSADKEKNYYKGIIPRNRMLNVYRDEKSGRSAVRITRGSVYAIRGQIFVPDENGNQKRIPKYVPWEMDEVLGSNLTRIFQRGLAPWTPDKKEGEGFDPHVPNKIEALVEVGRAHSEDGPYPGDFKLQLSTIFSTLSSEFSALKIPLDQVVMTGHFLDPQHTRFFTTFFPLRPLSSQTQQDLENDLVKTMANYLQTTPRPKNREEWKKMANTVTFGNLTQALKAQPPEDFSLTAKELVARSRGKLSGAQALQMATEFHTLFRDDLDYHFGRDGKSRGPLMIKNWTAMLAVQFYRMLESYGLKEGTPEFDGAKQWLEVMQKYIQVDMNTEVWIDPMIYQRGTGPQNHWNVPSVEVTNLDKDMMRQYPDAYVPSVILSIYDYVKSQINSPLYPDLLRMINMDRVRAQKPPFTSLDEVKFFETYPLSLNSTDPVIQRQLTLLGGKRSPGYAVLLKLTSDRQGVDVIQQQSDFYDFFPAQVQAIAARFPYLAQNAASRLKKSMHKERMQILQSGYK